MWHKVTGDEENQDLKIVVLTFWGIIVFNELNGQDPWRDEIKYEDFLRVCEKYNADDHILLSLLYFIDNVDG